MRRHLRAFTLLELMVVLVVVAALAFVATSSWPAYWQRMRRAAAGAALVSAVAQLELRHARTGSFEPSTLLTPPPPLPQADGYKLYSQPCGNDRNEERCVEMAAMPLHPDPLCGTLTLTTTGERRPAIPACWP
ncbi:prepilin-type N-terminal cleavage/methylation domain-containing protein [Ralstonia insidiosa]|jgi:type IV pilus assembly protein PilE|uniref:Uncharacterized protein n=1 Tax=Ralstonia insidiosa TaxID=190721 RepID=A0A191ZU48_9RALS|nr:prepilin-type N-terminal cleavage/methylation domain-containing protein [Ralstonia insidiosa]ANJ71621.1 hypothetical protein A9Y76_03630 [Ralstonia insidiosa]KAB0472226.1 prepilin-type N-terminal cleavage/methylation domain-containing protein [Ralstonia insidiosa]MBY4908194.1 prepilin-type N-terminal cleavage/methylation domain-containing protein [Ralstonia insidiosa]